MSVLSQALTYNFFNMRTLLLSSFLFVLPLFAFCQDNEAPQNSGSFYLETSNFTGAISSLTMNPSIGFAVTNNVVLGVGFGNITQVITDGYYDYEQRSIFLNLGGRYFLENNVFIGAGLGLSGAASGNSVEFDDVSLGVSLHAEIGKFLELGEHFYAAPKVIFTTAAEGDSDVAAGVAGAQITASFGVRL